MSAQSIGISVKATGLVIVLTAIASATGLFDPHVYTERFFGPAMRGQDLLTILSLPFLAITTLGARRGSTRSTIAWIGLLGYILYTYVGAAFAYRFNPLFLVYLVLFSLSLTAIVMAIGSADVQALHASFDASTPRKPVAAFLILIAVMLAVSELGQIIPALTSGTAPELIVRSEGAGNFIYVLDLGVVAPLALIAAVQLWRASPWGDVLAGLLLIKTLTMGLALLFMTGFALRAGQALELGLTIGYGVMTAGALALSSWFFRHCRDTEGAAERTALEEHG